MSAILDPHSIRHPQFATRSSPTPASATIHDLAVDSRGLLQGRSEVLIRHGNETYRLRHTRNDKLILTK